MTQTTLSSNFKELIASRHSVRLYDPTVKISREEMTEMLEEATMAPSSVNLQPWRFLVIDSPEGKTMLEELAPGNTRQVTTSSAVIAVFADMNAFDNAEFIMSTDVEKGFMPQEIKEQIMANYTALFGRMPAQAFREMILIDGGLVSMQLMLSAQAHGYDTNPIGGYDKSRIAEAFGMEKERYVPVMLISIGKSAQDPRITSRLPIDRIAEWK